MRCNATGSDIEMVKNEIANNDVLTSNTEYAAAPIDVAFDMGWQKRAGGRVYDSPPDLYLRLRNIS